MIDYQVLRSKRKTLSLQVKYGQVYVRAPLHVDEKYISSFISKKDAWLRAKIREQNQNDGLCCQFIHGSKLFLFGRLVTLNIKFAGLNEKPSTFLSNPTVAQQELIILLPTRLESKSLNGSQLASVVKKHVEKFFKEIAQEIILPKVAKYSELTQLFPVDIKIRQYSARWGSCNSRGELSFNYLLMMLPKQVIDYVIVHELCHLDYLNHSKQFWQLVAKHFPNYLEAKDWIKANQSALYWRKPS